jgi:hypothetical protein
MGTLYDGRSKFIDLKLPDKKKLIKGLITYLSSPGSRVDLSSIGGAKSAGQVKNGFISRDWDRVVIIDQSVTGMFESIRKKK